MLGIADAFFWHAGLTGLVALFTVLLLPLVTLLPYSVITARLIVADGELIGPWPQRVPVAELDRIQYIPGGFPAWAFIRRDGRRAFQVGGLLYSKADIARIALALSIPVAAPSSD